MSDADVSSPLGAAARTLCIPVRFHPPPSSALKRSVAFDSAAAAPPLRAPQAALPNGNDAAAAASLPQPRPSAPASSSSWLSSLDGVPDAASHTAAQQPAAPPYVSDCDGESVPPNAPLGSALTQHAWPIAVALLVVLLLVLAGAAGWVIWKRRRSGVNAATTGGAAQPPSQPVNAPASPLIMAPPPQSPPLALRDMRVPVGSPVAVAMSPLVGSPVVPATVAPARVVIPQERQPLLGRQQPTASPQPRGAHFAVKVPHAQTGATAHALPTPSPRTAAYRSSGVRDANVARLTGADDSAAGDESDESDGNDDRMVATRPIRMRTRQWSQRPQAWMAHAQQPPPPQRGPFPVPQRSPIESPAWHGADAAASILHPQQHQPPLVGTFGAAPDANSGDYDDDSGNNSDGDDHWVKAEQARRAYFASPQERAAQAMRLGPRAYSPDGTPMPAGRF